MGHIYKNVNKVITFVNNRLTGQIYHTLSIEIFLKSICPEVMYGQKPKSWSYVLFCAVSWVPIYFGWIIHLVCQQNNFIWILIKMDKWIRIPRPLVFFLPFILWARTRLKRRKEKGLMRDAWCAYVPQKTPTLGRETPILGGKESRSGIDHKNQY